MRLRRVWLALPYAVLLAVAAWFYKLASAIAFTHRGDTLGPDFWPRMILAALMLICAVQGTRLLLSERAAHRTGVGEGLDDEEDAPRSAPLLAAGLILTMGYGALITVLGFLIATFLFLVLFMYVGRYRSHAVIWLSSAAGTLLLFLIFQKVVYVSLPRGVPPFDRVGDVILSLF